MHPGRSVIRGPALALALALATTACAGATTDAGPTASATSSTAPSTTTVAAADIGKAEASLKIALASYAGRGDAAMVAVLRVGSQTRVVTAGFADAAHRRPVAESDRFRIASITKSMTAVAVLQYVASGRIGLDDPVDKWLPGLLPFPGITIRHLLSHRSGLHEPSDAEWAATRTDQDVVDVTVKHPLDFPAGSDGEYSNTGYTVLGLLVEKLSGQPLPVALERAVFDPAGMTSTTLGGKPSVAPLSGGVLVEDEGPTNSFRGAAQVVSTAADVDRFYEHLFAGDLIPEDLVETMATATGTSPFGLGGYGLGLWIWSMSCGEALGHSGALGGYATKAWTLRGTDRSVVVLVDDGQAHSFADNVAQAALCPG